MLFSMVHKEHHVGKTPLMNIDFGNEVLVSKFPLDCTHLIDLRVVHKLILYWKCNGEMRKKDSV